MRHWLILFVRSAEDSLVPWRLPSGTYRNQVHYTLIIARWTHDVPEQVNKNFTSSAETDFYSNQFLAAKVKLNLGRAYFKRKPYEYDGVLK